MTTPVLVVDMVAVLERSKAGAAAQARLQERYEKGRARFTTLSEKASKLKGKEAADAADAAATYERESLAGLEDERAKLRADVVSMAKAAATQIAADRGASVVVEKGATLFAADAADITDAVISAIDKA